MATREDLLALIQEDEAVSAPAPRATRADLDALIAQDEQTLLGSAKEMVTGEKRMAALPKDIQDLPELQSMGAPSTGAGVGSELKLGASLLTSMEPEARKDIVKNFIPEATFEDFEGTTVVTLPNGNRALLNAPGLSQADLYGVILEILAFIPAGKVTGLVKGAASKFGLGAAAGSATEAGKQEISQLVGSEQELDTGDIAIAGLTQGGGELAERGLKMAGEALEARRLGTESAALEEVRPAIEEGLETVEQTGIELLPAQKTLDPYGIEEQSFIASLPASSRKAKKALEKQNEQVNTAVTNFIADIAPPEALAAGGERLRDASKTAVDLVKGMRQQAARPLYKKAFNESKKVDISEVLEVIDQELQNLGEGKLKNKLLDTRSKLVSASEPNSKGQNLQKLHNAKIEIGDEMKVVGESSLLNSSKRQNAIILDKLVSVMEESAPDYKVAQQTFSELSGPVDKLLTSKIGQVSKVKDERLFSVSKTIFDEASTDPKVIASARDMIKSFDPDAWNSVVRQEAQRRLKNVSLDRDKITPDNAPAKIRTALFGEGNKRKIFLESLDPKQREKALWMEKGLERAALGRPGGSQTGVRGAISDSLKGGSLALKRWWREPVERLLATGDERAFNRNVRQMGDFLFDPKWTPRVRKIKKITPRSNAEYKATLQLLNDMDSDDEQ